MLESVRRCDELLDCALELLRHNRVAEVRVRVPQSRDDESLRERTAGATGANLHDHVLFPSDRPRSEAMAVVIPSRDALHAARWSGLA